MCRPGMSRFSTSACRASARTPHLLTVYALMVGTAMWPIIEPTSTTEPLPWRRRWGSTCRSTLAEPIRFVSTTASKSGAASSSRRP